VGRFFYAAAQWVKFSPISADKSYRSRSVQIQPASVKFSAARFSDSGRVEAGFLLRWPAC
jgi:hypothetical protein